MDGGHEQVLVSRPGQVGGDHRTDDPCGNGGVPHGPAGGTVEHPDRTTASGICALDDVEVSGALYVSQRRAAESAPVEPGRPLRLAGRVKSPDRVGIARSREKCACSDHDPSGPTREEVAYRGGRVDGLVGVVIANQPPSRIEHANVAPLRILLPEGVAGRLVAAFHDVQLSGAVEVGEGGGREVAVGRVERPSGQYPPAPAGQGVGALAEGSRHHVHPSLQVADRQRCLYTGSEIRIARRVGRRGQPQAIAGWAPGFVAAGEGFVEGVPDPGEHRVVGTAEPSYGRCRIDRIPGVHRPPRNGRTVREMVGVLLSAPVPHDNRWAIPIQGGHVGRRLGDRRTGVQ